MSETKTSPSPHIPAERAEYSRFPHGTAHLEALREENITSEDLERIVEICNQEAVFGEIAHHATGGEPYELKHAKQFLEIGTDGWKSKKMFIYVSRDDTDKIVSAIDIKSDDDIPEVGFWADKDSPGFVTNSLAALTQLAKAAGFQGLKGETRTDNERSANVFRRLGWHEEVVTSKTGQPKLRFTTRFDEET